jgi:hypothetical protein
MMMAPNYVGQQQCLPQPGQQYMQQAVVPQQYAAQPQYAAQ